MYIKSPIHYMGNKFDLLPYLIEQFPKKEEVSIFYDVFGGSGTISLNVPYDKIIYNEKDKNIVDILKMIKEEKPEDIFAHINTRIKQFELNPTETDIRSKDTSDEARQYYNNKYLIFREYYNNSKERDIKDLYTLSFYSFCNLMRFNSKGKFNVPYGNRCYLLNDDYKRIIDTHNRFSEKNITLLCGDSFDLLKTITKNENQFLYFDPPYYNSTAIYNENKKMWDIKEDNKLFLELDRLTSLGIKWAYSNVLEIKGKNNNHIEKWVKSNNYTIIELEEKDYSSIAKGNASAREVLIINYKQKVQRLKIFDFLKD